MINLPYWETQGDGGKKGERWATTYRRKRTKVKRIESSPVLWRKTEKNQPRRPGVTKLAASAQVLKAAHNEKVMLQTLPVPKTRNLIIPPVFSFGLLPLIIYQRLRFVLVSQVFKVPLKLFELDLPSEMKLLTSLSQTNVCSPWAAIAAGRGANIKQDCPK